MKVTRSRIIIALGACLAIFAGFILIKQLKGPKICGEWSLEGEHRSDWTWKLTASFDRKGNFEVTSFDHYSNRSESISGIYIFEESSDPPLLKFYPSVPLRSERSDKDNELAASLKFLGNDAVQAQRFWIGQAPSESEEEDSKPYVWKRTK